MKAFNFHKLITFLIAAVYIVSCVQDDQFDIPNTVSEAPTVEGEVLTIGGIKSALDQQINQAAADLGVDPEDFFYDNVIKGLRKTEQVLFEGENVFYIQGFVVSNDEAGNFFEELIIQDKRSNPLNGVRVLIDVSPLFTYVEFGRKVYIKLNGLTASYANGVFSLGFANGSNLGKIPEPQLTDFIIRDTIVAAIEPKVISFLDFNDSNVNQYVRLDNVQFEASQILSDNPQTYAGEELDEFDGERILESCESGRTVVFSTSTFADFKSVLLPAGYGSLDGLLSKDFFGETFTIVVNDPTTVFLNNVARCDQELVNCGLVDTVGSIVLFSDSFESQTENDPIAGNGWTNFAEEGTELWEADFDDDNAPSIGVFATMGSYNSEDYSTITWLITPEIDFDTQEGESLSFQSSNSFADGSEMQVLVSLDWDGLEENIPNANWSSLQEAYVVTDSDAFDSWLPSGNVSLDCLEGTGHIAFKYIGSGQSGFDGNFEIDAIEIMSN